MNLLDKCNHVSYGQAREHIQSADVLLFRPRKLAGISSAIAVAGRSEYCHAGMVAWWPCDVPKETQASWPWTPVDRLMCLETRSLRGGRAVLLSNLVKEIPGRIDVYNPYRSSTSGVDNWKIVETMLEITGRNYGWGSLLKVAFLHLPFVRFFRRPCLDDTANGSLPMCS